MVRTELVEKSPLRILEQSTHGGLGTGNVGVIAAPKGVGKTACLVHIATDQLMQEKHVVHISFAPDATHIVSWYEDIFDELARRNNLDCARDIHDRIIRNRLVMNFRQDSLPLVRIEESVRSLCQKADFHAEVLVVDGFDFSKAKPDDLKEIRRFAGELGLEVWMSASVEPNGHSGSSVPAVIAPFLGEISVLVTLTTADKHIRLRLLKDHDAPVSADMHLALDPKILLICEDR